MDILQHILGWNWKVRKLRKRWDRLREKALKKKNPVRNDMLKLLDVLAPNLTMLEEQKLSRADKARISKEIEIGLAEIKAMMDSKPEEVMASRRSVTKQIQRAQGP